MPKLRSLAFRSTLALLVPVLVSLAAVGDAGWAVARQALENELGLRLASAAGAAGSGLPLDLLLALQPGDEQTRTYRHAREQLQRALEAAELRRLAVFTPDGRAVVDTAGTPIGAELADLSRDRLELGRLWAGHATASALLFRGPDGRTYKSGYAPLRLEARGRADEPDRGLEGSGGFPPSRWEGGGTPGGPQADGRGLHGPPDSNDPHVVAGILAEGDAAFFSILGRLGARLLAVGFLGALLIALVSVLVARAIARPVRQLALAAQRIAGGDLGTPIAQRRGFDEVERLAGSLENMRLSLEGRDRQLQMMLSGIAHEVRNPLGGIELFAGLLRESLPAEGEAASHVRRVQQELGHLKRVVEDFLDYARTPEIERQPLEPAELAAEVAALVGGELAGRKLRLELSVAGETFRAEPTLLRRALLNLVQNAIQASPEGGTVRLGFERSGASSRWSVEDAGPGVPADKRAAIFEPFFTTRQKGTGLGLAFVRKIAEAHGGSVRVGTSSLGGARFDLELGA